jgi:hypothetical protein
VSDPVILSRTRQYGATDLGPDGISTFFARHECSRFCRYEWHGPRQAAVRFPPNLGTTFM